MCTLQLVTGNCQTMNWFFYLPRCVRLQKLDLSETLLKKFSKKEYQTVFCLLEISDWLIDHISSPICTRLSNKTSKILQTLFLQTTYIGLVFNERKIYRKSSTKFVLLLIRCHICFFCKSCQRVLNYFP